MSTHTPTKAVTETDDLEQGSLDKASPNPILTRERHGTLFTTFAHIITAMIGAGVLGLPNAVSWLGWVAGLGLITVFYASTILSSNLLAATVESQGVKHMTYRGLVLHILGPRASKVLWGFQCTLLFLAGIAYTIAAGESGRALLVSVGHYGADQSVWPIIVTFGGLQIVLSQFPNLDATWISSAVGAATSLGYSIIALGLCTARASNGLGTIEGNTQMNAVNKLFNVLNALGGVAFAYNFAPVLVEIQDTIRVPPSSDKTMKKAITISITIAYFFYMAISITGYLAFGNGVSGSILSQPNVGPVWVIVLANALVFTHMLSAVQLFTQPLYAAIEQGVARRWPWTPLSTSPRLTKLVWRSLYIALITFISALIPFFSQIIGLVGAVIYWPTAILFPVFVWLAVYPPHLSVRVGLQTLNAAMLIVAILAIVGSLRSIINNADTYGVFQ